ncbi:MAG: tRNA (adenosine(37)-N6)-threonylcarbamoyltransferase complex ATPase subunit type 1 TsaE [Hydrogeniiclostridium mannosilyticum]
MKMTTTSPRETELLGERLAQQLKGGEVLALFGGMGMGKTAFTRGLAHGLDVQEPVSSPTFALVNEYAGRLPLYHFDMYRVTSGTICIPPAFSIIWRRAEYW